MNKQFATPVVFFFASVIVLSPKFSVNSGGSVLPICRTCTGTDGAPMPPPTQKPPHAMVAMLDGAPMPPPTQKPPMVVSKVMDGAPMPPPTQKPPVAVTAGMLDGAPMPPPTQKPPRSGRTT